MLIVRLIAEGADLRARIEACLADLAQRGMSGHARCLGPHGALEIVCAQGGAAEAARAVMMAHLAPCDALITDHPPVIPRLFVSDMDSTMIAEECLDELADYAGLKPKVAAITAAAMAGQLDFAEALTERVGLLAGLDAAAIAACLATRISPMPGAATLVATLKAHGARAVLVTGGFHHFAGPIAAKLGFDHVVANRLEVAQGRLTGRLIGPLRDAASKLAVLREEAARLSEDAVSLATGDGANDVPMLRAATYGMAIHAKPAAKEAAAGWVDRGDLTSVLVLLGIPEAEWAHGDGDGDGW